MFKTIIVGTDGSANAERALVTAAELAGTIPGCRVHVLTACKPLAPQEVSDIKASLPKDLRSLIHANVEAEQRLGKAKTIFSAAGVEAEFHQVDEDPAEGLIIAAEQHSADLMIVGSRGEGLAKRAMHGSVSTKVVHHAPCSVLVVKDSL